MIGTAGRFEARYRCTESGLTASAFLAQQSTLSKAKIKEAMNKGAVWIRSAPVQGKPKPKQLRLRRATRVLKPGDRLAIYYDPELLALPVASGECLVDHDHYSIWYKPPGVLTQGTHWGDHCALLRHVERNHPRQAVYLVHRLDKEASGLILFAHTSEAAGKLSQLFQQRQVTKTYRVLVRGVFNEAMRSGTLQTPLDGKAAITHYSVLQIDDQQQTSLLEVQIETGRKHQIRRHLAEVGHPVLGDRCYGDRNASATTTLALQASALAFDCPIRRQAVRVALAQSYWLF